MFCINTRWLWFHLQQTRKTQHDWRIPETCATLPYWNCGNTRAALRRPRHLCQDCVVIAPAVAAVSSPFVQQGGGQQRPSSAHSSSLSGFHHSSIHLSVRSSLHPSVHIAFCCTCGSICHKSVAACRFTCRRLSRASLQVFRILYEMHNPVGLMSGWRHLQVHRGDFFCFFFTLILPIRPTYTELKAISLPLAELFSAVSGGIGGRSHPPDCFRYYLPSIAARTAVTLGSLSIQAIPPSFRLTSNRLKLVFARAINASKVDFNQGAKVAGTCKGWNSTPLTLGAEPAAAPPWPQRPPWSCL